jgi:DNA-damage-inducible protein J
MKSIHKIRIPNNQTIKAIKDARANKNMTKVSLENLKNNLFKY